MFGLGSFINKTLSIGPSVICQQTRNTFVLKRRWQVPLHKKGGRPTKLRGRHFVYDLVQDTNIVKKPDLQVILKEFVPGVGNVGDIVTKRPMQAYKELLLPGLAVYATPENLLKYKVDEEKPKIDDLFSSPYVQRTMRLLQKHVLAITMSKTEPWTLEPWHVKASFRKSGFHVPESAIEMPPVKISGPDLTLQEKEFYVTVTINNKERVNVRCRIHHWAVGLDRIPWELAHWKKPKEALVPEQAAALEAMPLPK